SLGSQAHTHADEDDYSLSLKFTRVHFRSGSTTFPVTVANVPPTVTAPANQSSNEGANASFALGSFTDPGANDSPWSVDVNWGDGTAHTTFTQNTRGSLGSQSHTYADNGTGPYTVTVK